MRLLALTVFVLATGCHLAPPLAKEKVVGNLAASGAASTATRDTVDDDSVSPDRTVMPLPAIPDVGIQKDGEQIVQLAAFQQVQTESTLEPLRVEPEPIGAPAPGPSSHLSLQNLEQMALATNPSVAQAAARVQALRGKWVQVGLYPNPTIGYLGADIAAEGTAGQQGGFVGQKFIRGGKLDLNRQVACWEIARAEQQLVAQRQRVLTDVRTAYYDVLIVHQKVELARELVNVTGEAVTTSRKLLAAKESPRVALLQTEVEAEGAQVVLRRAENESAAAWQRLATVTNQPGLVPQPLSGDPEEFTPRGDWNGELDRLLTESPELATAMADVDRARWALQRARVEATPDLNVQLALQHDNVIHDTLTGVQIGMPLPVWNRNQGGIQQAQSQVVAAVRNVERIELDLQHRLAGVFRDYADARAQVDAFSEKILPKAKETFDLVASGYRAGEVGYLDMLTAQRTYSKTNLLYIDSLRSLWRATLKMDGLLLGDSLQQAPSR